MQRKSAFCFTLLTFVGLLYSQNPPAPDAVGSSGWFDSMRKSDMNLAMFKALAGSNSQAVVPPDCVEISGVFALGRTSPFPKSGMPQLRIVSTDDRMDNVPRSPFIYQSESDAPNFYVVLKRELVYDFLWLGDRTVDSHCATWKVPADAPKQLRLVFSVDPQRACKITVATVAAPPRRK